MFFFLSSRRRHTSLVSDWISDVCSSDLLGFAWEPLPAAHHGFVVMERLPRETQARAEVIIVAAVRRRSEERRVGKKREALGSAHDVTKAVRTTVEVGERSMRSGEQRNTN